MCVHLSNCPKSELVPAWVASAINYLFSAQKEGQQLASARCPGPTVLTLFFASDLFIDVYSVSSLSLFQHKEKKKSLKQKATQMTWLCSFNGLMNNCRRADPAVTARSSVCSASMQDFYSVPLLILQGYHPARQMALITTSILTCHSLLHLKCTLSLFFSICPCFSST